MPQIKTRLNKNTLIQRIGDCIMGTTISGGLALKGVRHITAAASAGFRWLVNSVINVYALSGETLPQGALVIPYTGSLISLSTVGYQPFYVRHTNSSTNGPQTYYTDFLYVTSYPGTTSIKYIIPSYAGNATIPPVEFSEVAMPTLENASILSMTCFATPYIGMYEEANTVAFQLSVLNLQPNDITDSAVFTIDTSGFMPNASGNENAIYSPGASAALGL